MSSSPIPSASPDDDAPASVEEMLAISERQTRRVEDIYRRPTTVIVFIWGVAWLVGFLLLWSGTSANPWFQTPGAIANIGFAALMVAGVVSSAVIGTMTGRGVQGAQQSQGAMYGIGWAISTCAAAIFGGGMLANGMSGELAAVFFPAVYSLVVGILYLAGGALWRDRVMYVVGCWIIVIGVLAPFFGVPGNSLVMAFAGGGGFLVYGFLLVTVGRRIMPRGSGRRA